MNQLLKQAIEELKNLRSGEAFLVKELFKGYEWNRIDRAERLQLGTLFVNEVQNNPLLVGKVKKLDKTSSNQQKYQMI